MSSPSAPPISLGIPVQGGVVPGGVPAASQVLHLQCGNSMCDFHLSTFEFVWDESEELEESSSSDSSDTSADETCGNGADLQDTAEHADLQDTEERGPPLVQYGGDKMCAAKSQNAEGNMTREVGSADTIIEMKN